MKIWTVITGDNEKKSWYGTWSQRITRRFPRVGKDGLVRLDGFPYVPNPKLVIRETYRPKKFLYLVEVEDQFYYFRQNEPDQIDFSMKALTPGSIGITGETIKEYAKSQHLKRLVAQDTNWYAILAFIGILGMLAAFAALYFRR